MDKTIRSALQLYDYGLISMPLLEKRPVIKQWSTRFLEIPLTKEEIVHGISGTSGSTTSYENMNLGVVTGRVSNVIVLDIDDMSSLTRLQQFGKLPRTWTVQSNRGVHLYFNYDDRISSMKLWDTIDILSDGKQAVVPPSQHPSGKIYGWIISPRMTAKADLPQWLIELLFATKDNSISKVYPKNKQINRTIDWERIDWINFYSAFVKNIRGNGQWRSSTCPFHDDNNNSFGFNIANGSFSCFAGCGKGSGLQAVQRLYGISRHQALRLLKGENVYV